MKPLPHYVDILQIIDSLKNTLNSPRGTEQSYFPSIDDLVFDLHNQLLGQLQLKEFFGKCSDSTRGYLVTIGVKLSSGGSDRRERYKKCKNDQPQLTNLLLPK